MKIALDAGHGLSTPGKRCLKSLDPKETREWVLNDRVVREISRHLERCGIDTLRLDDATGGTDVALAKRTAAANGWGADCCVSIHHNAGIRGGNGGGAVVYVYSGTHSPLSDTLQKSVYDGLISAVGLFGNRANPLGQKDLHMLRETKMPSILVEVGFMDSAEDIRLILEEEWANRAARGIARGICGAMGVNWVEDFTPYLATVTAHRLNVRSGASARTEITGKLTAGETLLIAEERFNGTTRWGKLNVGLGWISLEYTKTL